MFNNDEYYYIIISIFNRIRLLINIICRNFGMKRKKAQEKGDHDLERNN